MKFAPLYTFLPTHLPCLTLYFLFICPALQLSFLSPRTPFFSLFERKWQNRHKETNNHWKSFEIEKWQPKLSTIGIGYIERRVAGCHWSLGQDPSIAGEPVAFCLLSPKFRATQTILRLVRNGRAFVFRGQQRGCRGVVIPACLGHPLSVVNKNSIFKQNHVIT